LSESPSAAAEDDTLVEIQAAVEITIAVISLVIEAIGVTASAFLSDDDLAGVGIRAPARTTISGNGFMRLASCACAKPM